VFNNSSNKLFSPSIVWRSTAVKNHAFHGQKKGFKMLEVRFVPILSGISGTYKKWRHLSLN
jgi:hypothetical protein